MKHQVLIALFMIGILTAKSSIYYDFKVDGIYYSIVNDSSVYVSYEKPGYEHYFGDVVIPEKVSNNGKNYAVTGISSMAFEYDVNVTSVYLPNTITNIRPNAFYGCQGLTRINIPSSVTTIGNSAFGLCTSLTRIDITDFDAWCRIDYGDGSVQSNPLYYAHHLFLNNQEVFDIIIPKTLISRRTFAGWESLNSVAFGDSVTSIDESTFTGCRGLAYVIFGKSLVSLEQYAFMGCYNLKDVTCFATTPPTSNYAFPREEIREANPTLHVPASSLAAYKSAYNWNSFPTIIGDAIELQNIVINKNEIELSRDEQSIIEATIYPNNAMPNNIFWRSSDITVATVDRGIVTAIAPGECDITVSCQSHTAVCHVTVNYPLILSSYIELNITDAEIKKGETLQLTATVLPINADNKAVTWATTNKSVAKVDQNGLIKAISPGTAIITATTVDGSNLSASCLISVYDDATSNINTFHVNDTSVTNGTIIIMPIVMNNSDTIVAFQTDIYLPNDFSIATNEDNTCTILPSNRLTNNHVIETEILNDGAIRIVCSSTNSNIIYGNEGELFYIYVMIPQKADGLYAMSLRNTFLTTNCSNIISVENDIAFIDVHGFIAGDVNHDGETTIADINSIIETIISGTNNIAADINNDSEITIADINTEIDIILNGSHPNSTSVTPPAQTGTLNDFGFVDLGLSVKWATNNVSANHFSDYGDFFAWGETNKKNQYDWSTYKFSEAGASKMTKYNCSDLGSIKDGLYVLEEVDDAATKLMGDGWRMPTLLEMNELLENCSWTWHNNYQGMGNNGYLVRSKVPGYTDNCIFLPAAGYKAGKAHADINQVGTYWTSSLNYESFASLKSAQLYFNNSGYLTDSYDRQIGMSIRAVFGERNQHDNLPLFVSNISTQITSTDVIFTIQLISGQLIDYGWELSEDAIFTEVIDAKEISSAQVDYYQNTLRLVIPLSELYAHYMNYYIRAYASTSRGTAYSD